VVLAEEASLCASIVLTPPAGDIHARRPKVMAMPDEFLDGAPTVRKAERRRTRDD